MASSKKRNASGVIDAEFGEEPQGAPPGARHWQPGDGCFPPPGEPGSHFNADGSPRSRDQGQAHYVPKTPEETKAYQMGLEEALRYFNSIPTALPAPRKTPWGVIFASAMGSAIGGMLWELTETSPGVITETLRAARPQLEQLIGNPDRADVVHFLLEQDKKNKGGYFDLKEIIKGIEKGAHVGAADKAHARARARSRMRPKKRSKRSKKPATPSKETP